MKKTKLFSTCFSLSLTLLLSTACLKKESKKSDGVIAPPAATTTPTPVYDQVTEEEMEGIYKTACRVTSGLGSPFDGVTWNKQTLEVTNQQQLILTSRYYNADECEANGSNVMSVEVSGVLLESIGEASTLAGATKFSYDIYETRVFINNIPGDTTIKAALVSGCANNGFTIGVIPGYDVNGITCTLGTTSVVFGNYSDKRYNIVERSGTSLMMGQPENPFSLGNESTYPSATPVVYTKQ